MTIERMDGIVLADLASNLLAACLIVLILLGASDRSPPVTGPEPAALDAERDLMAKPRRPLAPAESVEMLRGRRIGAPGLSIDVGARTARFSLADRPLPVPAERLEEVLAALPPGVPVRLYVFGHDGYAPLVRRLEAAGLAWQEISVPLALRRAAVGPGATDWSQGFQALLGNAEDPARFRQDLARLLAGDPAGSRDGGGRGGLAGGHRSPDDPGVLGAAARALAALRTGLEAAVLLAGALTVLVVERRRMRRRRTGAAG